MTSIVPLAGFFTGLLVGLTGIGGGALMTPLLILLLGVAPRLAIGTDLLFACITKVFGTWMYGRNNAIDWRVLGYLSMGSLPASVATLLWLGTARLDAADELVILKALGTMLALTGTALLFKSRMHGVGQRLRTDEPVSFKRVQPALTVATGAVIGCLVTLTSVGAGALGAAVLLFLYPYRLSPAKLVGTDIAHAMLLTLVAGFGHGALGNVDLLLLGGLLLGSIPGVLVGAWFSPRIDGRLLRQLLAGLLLIVGGKMLLFQT